MKKTIILLVVVLLSQIGFAQENEEQNYSNQYVEFGLNPDVLLSEDTKGDLNWFVKLGHNFDNNNSIAIFYERYNAENYISYGVQPSSSVNIVGGLQLGLGVEVSVIERYDIGKSLISSGYRNHYLTGAISGDISYQFDKYFTIYYSGDLKYRPDLDGEWDLSPSIGFRFGFM
jgi:hypothetical protein